LTEQAVPPHFALSWLGMGADGHVASLFPNTDPRIDDPAPVRRITPDPLPPEAPFDRLTLTLPALLSSDALVFVIRGAEKRRLTICPWRACLRHGANRSPASSEPGSSAPDRSTDCHEKSHEGWCCAAAVFIWQGCLIPASRPQPLRFPWASAN
jgi:hypothetical protein